MQLLATCDCKALSTDQVCYQATVIYIADWTHTLPILAMVRVVGCSGLMLNYRCVCVRLGSALQEHL